MWPVNVDLGVVDAVELCSVVPYPPPHKNKTDVVLNKKMILQVREGPHWRLFKSTWAASRGSFHCEYVLSDGRAHRGSSSSKFELMRITTVVLFYRAPHDCSA